MLARTQQDRCKVTSDRLQRCIDELLDEADKAVTAGDWDRVRTSAETVLALSPDLNRRILVALQEQGFNVADILAATPA
jgi:ABC-type cobalamin transport system ATPase subunit